MKIRCIFFGNRGETLVDSVQVLICGSGGSGHVAGAPGCISICVFVCKVAGWEKMDFGGKLTTEIFTLVRP